MARIAWFSLALVGLVIAGVVGLGCVLNAPGYDGPKPAQAPFDGETFQNQVPISDKSAAKVMVWRFQNPGPEWAWRDNWRYPAPPKRTGPGEMHVTWVNHATVLLQMDGVNILTDPIFSGRASPFQWVGPERLRAPGIALVDLPPIDVVVLSHNHYDHFDIASLTALFERDKPVFLGGLGTKAILDEEDIGGAMDLDWWQSHVIKGVTVHAVPAQHWSRRGIGDTRNTLWAGYVFESGVSKAYFAGDTGFGPHFEQIYERFGAVQLALLPIGPFKPQWLMKDNHISPSEAADVALVLRAQATVPIHFGTFNLGDDEQDEDVLVLNAYLAQLAAPPTFWVLDLGEGRDVPGLTTAREAMPGAGTTSP